MSGRPALSEADRIERDVDGRPSVVLEDRLLAKLRCLHPERDPHPLSPLAVEGVVDASADGPADDDRASDK